ncbi:DDE-type integrase/transposase/recombinase [Legionella steelei]
MYYLWRAINEEGYELDVFLQNHRNKKSSIRVLFCLLCPIPSSERL